MQVANLAVYWAGREPPLRPFCSRITSDILQWIYDIERQDIRRVTRHGSIDVLLRTAFAQSFIAARISASSGFAVVMSRSLFTDDRSLHASTTTLKPP
jgi:hypothetical protein